MVAACRFDFQGLTWSQKQAMYYISQQHELSYSCNVFFFLAVKWWHFEQSVRGNISNVTLTFKWSYQWVTNLDMKTKVARHVQGISCHTWVTWLKWSILFINCKVKNVWPQHIYAYHVDSRGFNWDNVNIWIQPKLVRRDFLSIAFCQQYCCKILKNAEFKNRKCM